jgi:diguanylate cyclase (GGDEF)-like protein
LNAGVLGERLRQRVEGETFDYQGTRLPVTISVGVAALPEANVETAQELVSAADGSLYEAKRSGRNRVCLHGL